MLGEASNDPRICNFIQRPPTLSSYGAIVVRPKASGYLICDAFEIACVALVQYHLISSLLTSSYSVMVVVH